jgi:hypothetical protein
MHRLCEIHDELLQAIAAARDRLRGRQLTTFFPMRGMSATGELMVVGRAVRGWQKKPWTAHDVVDAEFRARIIREVFNWSSPEDGCPMQWVNMARGRRKSKMYNSRSSAFWRVIGCVSQSIMGAGNDWPSKLIWSDLYKVAPFGGGNPGGRLIAAQFETCKRHLAEEISFWMPKRILFLTGWNWVESFLPALGRSVGERRDGDIQWFGSLQLPDGNTPRVVVCVHPQGRKEAAIVQGIIQCFA